MPLRERIAAAVNTQMERLERTTGISQRRFTHLSNKERGLSPGTKQEGKHGPGRKARDRKLEAAALARSEAVLQRDRISVIDDLATTVKEIAARASIDVTAVVTSARAAVAERMRALTEMSVTVAGAVPAAYAPTLREATIAGGENASAVPALSPLRRFALTGDLFVARAREQDGDRAMRHAPALSEAAALSRVFALRDKPGPLAHNGLPGIVTLKDTIAAVPTVASSPPPTAIPADSGSTSGRRAVGEPDAVDLVTGELLERRFLPIRPMPTDGDGRERDRKSSVSFALDVSKAVAGDEDLLRRAATVQRDARLQDLLRLAFERMLERVRHDLMVREERPTGKLLDIFGTDPSLRAAIRAAWPDERLRRVVAEAQSYWQQRNGPPDRRTHTISGGDDGSNRGEHDQSLPDENAADRFSVEQQAYFLSEGSGRTR